MVTDSRAGGPIPIDSTGAVTGNALVYDSVEGVWEPGAGGGGGALLCASCASPVNVASLSGLLVIDGYQTVAGDRVLLTAQSTASQNGVWVAASGAWTRPADFAHGTVFT